jgi:uncharacterized protein (DUF305 family)
MATSPPAVRVSIEHNAADAAFAQGMIPHHAQAISMARLAPTRASSAEVKDLAAKIEAAQDPEIGLMNSMLTAWGSPTVSPDPNGMHATPDGASMAGMMSGEQMTQLAALSGPAFDRAFLEMMMQHHSGAIQMAQAEQAQGSNPQATDLAGRIIADQQQEILQMQTLLGRV